MNPAIIHLSDPDPLHRTLDYWETRYDPVDRCPHCGDYQLCDEPCCCLSDWEGNDDDQV